MIESERETCPTDRGADAPWNRVVRALRDEARARRIPPTELLELLGCRKQVLTDWSSTGPWKKAAPLWVVRRLLERLELVLILTPDQVVLVPRAELSL